MESSALNEEELLSDKLGKASEEYFKESWLDLKRQNLLQFLQNNDCREVISKSVDDDIFSNVFTIAGIRNHPDILRALLDNGMNVDSKCRDGNTALTFSCMEGYEDSVRLLCDRHANLDHQNKTGMTGLMFASSRGNKETVQFLLDHNADINLINKFGKTALDLADTDAIKEMLQNHVNTSYVLK